MSLCIEADPEKARLWYTKAAEAGDTQSQYELARIYDDGNGVPKNPSLAAKWYRAAAENGQVKAQNYLGTMLESGEGIDDSPSQAVYWYQKSAEKGYRYAQYNLGRAYNEGIGIAQNKTKAFEWFKKAAAQGHEVANLHLAAAYIDGVGTHKNGKEALRILTPLAQGGNADAQYYIGIIYERGLGVPANRVDARKWYFMASGQGHKAAQQAFANVSKRSFMATLLPEEVRVLPERCQVFYETYHNCKTSYGSKENIPQCKTTWQPFYDCREKYLNSRKMKYKDLLVEAEILQIREKCNNPLRGGCDAALKCGRYYPYIHPESGKGKYRYHEVYVVSTSPPDVKTDTIDEVFSLYKKRKTLSKYKVLSRGGTYPRNRVKPVVWPHMSGQYFNGRENLCEPYRAGYLSCSERRSYCTKRKARY